MSEYLQLRNAGGGNLKGLCPFHDEKSPSFHVSPAKGLYHCFGCQEGGDTVDFIMKIDHLSFAETIERLAAIAGITLRYEEGGYTPAASRASGPAWWRPTRPPRSSTSSSSTAPRPRSPVRSSPSVASTRPPPSTSVSVTARPAGTTSPASCGAAVSATRN
nr:CHC2 zinc finger domain-containing protein [Streptomyces sp. MST-110588]